MSEITLSESEATKLENVAEITQNYFIARVGSSIRSNIIELDTDAKLFLLQNEIHNFANQLPGRLHALDLVAQLISPSESIFYLDAQLYRSENLSLLPRMYLPALSESFEEGQLLMCFWERGHQELGILNLSNATLLSMEGILKNFLNREAPSPIAPDSRDSEARVNEEVTNVSSPHSASQPEAAASESAIIGNPHEEEFDIIREVFSRSFGGTLVAESPTSSSIPDYLKGALSPGLEIASEALKRLLTSRSSSKISVFLIGGPGSGKSTFAKGMLLDAGFTLESVKSASKRSYDLSSELGQVRFVNDATIKIKGGSSSLVSDLQFSADNQTHLVACANRGIIADELNLINSDGSGVEDVLRWLSQEDNLGDESETFYSWTKSDYFQLATQKSADGAERVFLAVFMDVCSLLESQPMPRLGATWQELDAPQVVIGAATDSGYFGSDESPLSKLLHSIASEITPSYLMQRFNLDLNHPVVSNAKQLGSSEFRRGLVSAMRVAEINSGSRLNYRGFWSVVSRSLFGNLPLSLDFKDLQTALSGIQEQMSAPLSFESMLDLAQLRTPNALFESKATGQLASADGDPGFKFLRSVDPVIAVQLGGHSSAQQESFKGVDAIFDSFQALEPGTGILEFLENLEAPKGSEFTTDFDRVLDTAFSKLSLDSSVPEKQKNNLTFQYSKYLLRLFSIPSGYCAGREEAMTWLDLWSFAPEIPHDNSLLAKFESLLKPKANHGLNSQSLLPVLEARAIPIVGRTAKKRIAISLDILQLSTSIQGSDLFLVLKEHGSQVGKIHIDFPLLREVLASSQNGNGVTEMSFYVAPRLERVRSSKLVPRPGSNSANYVLVESDGTRGVQIGRGATR